VNGTGYQGIEIWASNDTKIVPATTSRALRTNALDRLSLWGTTRSTIVP
jgi:hypothetical protein